MDVGVFVRYISFWRVVLCVAEGEHYPEGSHQGPVRVAAIMRPCLLSYLDVH